jgi:hypothetical protein
MTALFLNSKNAFIFHDMKQLHFIGDELGAYKILSESEIIISRQSPPEGSILLVDLGNNPEKFIPVAASHAGRGAALCVTAPQFSNEIDQFLRANGIARFLDYQTLGRFPDILAGSEYCGGNVLIIDENPVCSRIVGSIISLFGYRHQCASTIEEVIEQTEKGYLMAIHNISGGSFDLMTFVRRVSQTGLSQMPYIAYTGDGDHVTVREIHSGIGRLTRIILSYGEMLSTLAYNLFMFEFQSRVESIRIASELPSRRAFSEGSLKKTFFSHKEIFFSSKMKSSILPLLDLTSAFKKPQETLSRMASIEWLLHDNNHQTVGQHRSES